MFGFFCKKKYLTAEEFACILHAVLKQFYKENVMEEINDIKAKVDTLNTMLSDVAADLGRIKDVVTALKAGEVTQEELDALGAAVDSAVEKAGGIKDAEGQIA